MHSISKVLGKREFVFALVTRSRTFYLQAPDQVHFDHWMESIGAYKVEISATNFIETAGLSSDSELESIEFISPNQAFIQDQSPDLILKNGYFKKQSTQLGKVFF